MKKRSFVKGTFFAAAAGFVAGILLAPKSGKETRQDIKEAAVTVKGQAERELKKVYADLNNTMQQVSERATELKAKGKAELNDALKTADIARAKARDILDAFQKGSADDKTLDKAVKDAQLALRHLQEFIKK